MIKHQEISSADLRGKIKNKEICFGGNARLMIYGKLDCKSGKRTKPENRIFFETENEARSAGFRPCGNCLNVKYKQWIYLTTQ
ncbi:metal-binding protein [Pedobacter chinensis]|uniref:Metal-binding protein n=1 Tax=Pedobacter chinensis TaxID=2282421 RepID=A0A369PUV9_9SPHI|nr:Ada metal-binding domain-containing protein [Pedobacter chinensis]RDC56304.1 metal-binding protein [Pedobacter chinensis]